MGRITSEHAGLHLLAELLDVPAPSGHDDRKAAFDRVLTAAGALLTNL